MDEDRTVRTGRLIAFSAILAAPLAGACANHTQTSAATPATSVAVAQQPPPGYATAPPPGYPTAPPGYPQAQPVYTAPPAYPPQAAAPQPAPAAQPAYYPPAATAPAATPPAYPTAAPTGNAAPAPSGQLAPTDPNSLQAILTGLQGALQGTLVTPAGTAAPGDLTEIGLKAEAMRVAPGMQPEGSELKQNLPEGQHAVMMVTLQAGKCYSIVGFSPLGAVKDVDLNLLAPPLYLTLAGQDLTHNNTPTIGASPNPMCPVIAFPLQYKLDVFARSGSGQVVVQLYSKSK